MTTNNRTQEFLDEVADYSYAITETLAGGKAKEALRDLAAKVEARDTQGIAGVAPEDVHLTDAQWAKLAKKTRVMASFSSESY